MVTYHLGQAALVALAPALTQGVRAVSPGPTDRGRLPLEPTTLRAENHLMSSGGRDRSRRSRAQGAARRHRGGGRAGAVRGLVAGPGRGSGHRLPARQRLGRRHGPTTATSRSSPATPPTELVANEQAGAPGPEVLSVEADQTMHALDAGENDPLRSQQWALDQVPFEAAWTVTRGAGREGRGRRLRRRGEPRGPRGLGAARASTTSNPGGDGRTDPERSRHARRRRSSPRTSNNGARHRGRGARREDPAGARARHERRRRRVERRQGDHLGGRPRRAGRST